MSDQDESKQPAWGSTVLFDGEAPADSDMEEQWVAAWDPVPEDNNACMTFQRMLPRLGPKVPPNSECAIATICVKANPHTNSRGSFHYIYNIPAPTAGVMEEDDLPMGPLTLTRTDTYAMEDEPVGFLQAAVSRPDTLHGKLHHITQDVLLGIVIREECQRMCTVGRKQRVASETAKRVFSELLTEHAIDCPPTPTDLTMFYALVMKAAPEFSSSQLSDIITFGRRVFFYDDNRSVLRYLRAMKELLGGCSTDGDWRQHLQMGRELMSECNRQSVERVALKMQRPIDVDAHLIESTVDACVLTPALVCARRTSLFICRWIGIQLAIGCRMCEVVLPGVRFEAVSTFERNNPSRYIKQIGRAKDRNGEYVNAALIKEIVGNVTSQQLLECIHDVRAAASKLLCISLDSIQSDAVNRRFNATAVCIVKRLFPSQAAHCLSQRLGFGTHFLRAAWVNYNWEIHRSDPDCPTQTHFIAAHLGHDMSFSSAKNYECVRVRRTASTCGAPVACIPVADARAESPSRGGPGGGGAGQCKIEDRWDGDIPVFTASDPLSVGRPAKRMKID